MGKILLGIGTFIVVILILYLAYINGFLVTQVKSAVCYHEYNGGKRAKFRACNGFTRRVLRFKNTGNITVELQTDLMNGKVFAEILNRDKKPLAHLGSIHKRISLSVESGQRYYLKMIFDRAEGNYELHIM